MAFAASKSGESVFGNKRVTYGTFTQGDGDTGGAVDTGLSTVDFFQASYMTDASNDDGTVTITTADPGDDQSGFWFAFGY